MVTRTRSALALVLAVAIAGACSGDDDADTGAGTGTASAPVTPAPDTSAPVTTATPTTEPAPTTEPPTTEPPTTAAPVDDGYPDQPAGVAFPAAEWPQGQLPSGVDRAAIDAAVDAAFGAPDAPARLRSVVVVHGGQVVYERYHPLDGPDVVYDSFSVSKSFTSSLIGLLVDDGRLSLDGHPPRPEWPEGDPRTEITVRDLLQMSSGLNWAEEYGPESLPIRMITAPDAAAFVASQPLEADPGTLFDYSTGTTALLVGIAADELGGCAATTAYFEDRMLGPLGITTDDFMTDGRGCWLGGLGANMTTRDFARFGLLYLRGGHWNGEQILSTAWIDETRVPATTQSNYGLQWWLAADGRSFAAEGLFGQKIVVVPDDDLVIAMNATQGGDSGTPAAVVMGQFAGAG